MREIVTLQLGNLSNYVATHFWNTQESYFSYSEQEPSAVNPNIHWRPGVGADGSDTFLPRTVVYDLKGGFGSLRKINALYEASDDAASSSLWSAPPSTVHRQPTIEPSAFQQSLDAGTPPPQLTTASVRYWSDFSRVFFHPRSLVQLYDYELHSTLRPFERFATGADLFADLDRDHDLLDRDWRPFVEEADRLQAAQLFASLDDAWGGFAAAYLEALRDEHPKLPIWTWGLRAPVGAAPREKRQLRLANVAQSLSHACAQSSMVVPLAVPQGALPSNVSLDAASPWHVSALLATAAETATLPSRPASEADQPAGSLGDMAEALNTGGNQTLANMRMAVGSQAARASEDDQQSLDIDLSGLGRGPAAGGDRRAPRIFGQISSVRGIDAAGNDIETLSNRLDQRPLVGQSIFRSYPTPLKFPLLDSFPSIYNDAAGQAGIDVRTALVTDSSVAASIKNLRSQVTWSVGRDERETLANGLDEIADAYKDDWSSGSDEDNDDY